MRECESTMTRMRQYDDDSAQLRLRECDMAITRMRERQSTMTRMRQYDDDSATNTMARTRWRECDDTMATVRYDYRIVAIVLSHCRNRIVALSHIAFSHSRHRVLTFAPSYCRTVVIVLSNSCHRTLAFSHSRPLDFNV
ncbi:hypothetical protein DPMN_099109 [Dreissena polymorpha]|uniref:Uncharacterized protein n=1 Tax=Dreissena polymorpha TaxID=45954 RepID=A0A9D4LEW3_DREPO|nr:hypothetical protein DPMN_099109 [Dreissena polymorpha]